MRSRRLPGRLVALGVLGAIGLVAGASRAEVVWEGNFETGDLGQWGYVLNGEHISVVSDPVVEGANAGRIQLTNDAVWPNGLKRVELQHGPAEGRTAEGETTCFAWSFYLPETLPTEPSAQIGYWESNTSYQQMMAFEVSGESISFSTREPQNDVKWDADGRVTANVWHRIAMCVLWSQDPGIGKVDVWFDGEQVVTQGAAKTLADGNACFTQVGLLRGAVEFEDSPVIVIDDAVEGDTVDDVRPAPPSGEGGAGGGSGSGTGGESLAGSGGDDPTTTTAAGGEGGYDGPAASSGSGPSTSSSATSGVTGAGGSGGDPASESEDDGCGCRLAGVTPARHHAMLVMAGLVAAATLRRRRRA